MDGNSAGTSETKSALFASHVPPSGSVLRNDEVARQVEGAAVADSFPGFPHQGYTDEELVTLQDRLATLMNTATSFPLEYSLGDCAFLFESRDDIAVIVDSLEDQITSTHRTA
jgi:hypothetical protein